jgi:hypothetical protein
VKDGEQGRGSRARQKIQKKPRRYLFPADEIYALYTLLRKNENSFSVSQWNLVLFNLKPPATPSHTGLICKILPLIQTPDPHHQIIQLSEVDRFQDPAIGTTVYTLHSSYFDSIRDPETVKMGMRPWTGKW